MRRLTKERTILDGVQTDGFGTTMFIGDYQHKIITIATSGMGAGDSIVFKFAASTQDDAPTFSTAKSATNRWDYVRVRDLQSGDLILGDDGITIEADDVRQYAVEDDNFNWLNVEATISDETNTFAYAYLACANDSE